MILKKLHQLNKRYNELDLILFWWVVVFAISLYIHIKGYPDLAILIGIFFIPLFIHDIIAKFYSGIVKAHIVKIKVNKT